MLDDGRSTNTPSNCCSNGRRINPADRTTNGSVSQGTPPAAISMPPICECPRTKEYIYPIDILLGLIVGGHSRIFQ